MTVRPEIAVVATVPDEIHDQNLGSALKPPPAVAESRLAAPRQRIALQRQRTRRRLSRGKARRSRIRQHLGATTRASGGSDRATPAVARSSDRSVRGSSAEPSVGIGVQRGVALGEGGSSRQRVRELATRSATSAMGEVFLRSCLRLSETLTTDLLMTVSARIRCSGTGGCAERMRKSAAMSRMRASASVGVKTRGIVARHREIVQRGPVSPPLEAVGQRLAISLRRP